MHPAALARLLQRELVDAVLPQRCLVCGHFGAALHATCVERLPAAEPPRCTVCWSPSRATWCDRCAAGAGPDFDALRTRFRFEGFARRAVLEAKFGGVRSLLPPLALAAAEAVPPEWRVDAVVPVPLWPARERRRGFNQAAVAGRVVAQALGVPFAPEVLRRTRAAPPQASLDAARRLRNVEGVYGARGQPPRRPLLVDDVTTTGATLSAAAGALRAAGAERVWALALARED